MKEEWDESAHQRDEKGRFAGGGSGEAESSESGSTVSGRYNIQKIVGKTTSTGVEVKGVSRHAQTRMRQRHISASKVAKVLESKDSVITEGHDGRTLYFRDNVRVVFNKSDGTVVTCVRRGKP